MATFDGPLPACEALDSLAGFIALQIGEKIKARESIAESVKYGLIKEVDDVVAKAFTEGTVMDLRTYIHELARNQVTYREKTAGMPEKGT